MYRNSLEGLPNEVLEMVLGIFFPTDSRYVLQGLVEATRQASGTLQRCPHAISIRATHYSEMHVQLQQTYCRVISLRQPRRYHAVDESLRTYIDTLLREQPIAIELEFGFKWGSDSIDMLNGAANI